MAQPLRLYSIELPQRRWCCPAQRVEDFGQDPAGRCQAHSVLVPCCLWQSHNIAATAQRSGSKSSNKILLIVIMAHGVLATFCLLTSRSLAAAAQHSEWKASGEISLVVITAHSVPATFCLLRSHSFAAAA